MTITEFEHRAKHQNGYDREFDNWKVIDIHQTPSEFTERSEVDFYCSNGESVYLLRLRNCESEFYETNNQSENLGYPTYLIAEFPFQKIDDQLIKNALSKFAL